VAKNHNYHITLRWTGNSGTGTSSYTAYQRSYQFTALNKPVLEGSSDKVFRGDKSKYNPEDLLVAALSACHMLVYLHLCANAGIVVLGYEDRAEGVMTEQPDGGGSFQEVTLKPAVLIENRDGRQKAHELHKRANKLCFIANSVKFPVKHKPRILVRKA